MKRRIILCTKKIDCKRMKLNEIGINETHIALVYECPICKNKKTIKISI